MTIAVIQNIKFPPELEPNSKESISAAISKCNLGDGFVLKADSEEKAKSLIGRVRRAGDDHNKAIVSFVLSKGNGEFEVMIKVTGAIKRRKGGQMDKDQLSLLPETDHE